MLNGRVDDRDQKIKDLETQLKQANNETQVQVGIVTERNQEIEKLKNEIQRLMDLNSQGDANATGLLAQL